MAEFCLDCFNKINGTNDSEDDYIISDDLELCEGCGQWKHVVVMYRTDYEMEKYLYNHEHNGLFYDILCGIVKLLTFPCGLYKRKKLKIKSDPKHF